VKLNAVDGELLVPHGHYLVAARGRELETDRQLVGGERVVAAGLEVLRQAVEDAAPVVMNGARLAVDERLGQTPSVGTRVPRRLISSIETPALAGTPGPGEMTR
jgi:hypothetical protein